MINTVFSPYHEGVKRSPLNPPQSSSFKATRHSLTVEETIGYGPTRSNRQAITGAVGFTFFAGVLQKKIKKKR